MRLVVARAGAVAILFLAATFAHAKTIAVTTTSDTVAVDGAVSLREAITSFNAASDVNGDVPAGGTYGSSDTVSFNIAGAGPHTITLGSSLPTINVPLTIDGFTQPLSSANTLAAGDDSVHKIVLHDTSGTQVLRLGSGSSGSVIRGLVLSTDNGNLIHLADSSNNTIQGNFFGLNAAGTAAVGGGGGSGVVMAPSAVETTANNQIGGTTPAARNVFVMGGRGVFIIPFGGNAGSNIIEGNYFGTNAAGTAGLGVQLTGITIGGGGGGVLGGTRIGANSGSLGGSCSNGCNLIAGNIGDGVIVDTAVNTTIIGNFVGTDVTGTTAIGNGTNRSGIIFSSASLVFIGGTAAGAGNLISGHSGSGHGISGSSGSSATIQGNFIGVATNGTTALGNGGHGILLSGQNGATVGGTTAAARNIISSNGFSSSLAAINLEGSTSITIQGNYIGTAADGTTDRGNAGPGIVLTTGSLPTDGNIIGPATSGGAGGNVIAFNGVNSTIGSGVWVFSGTDNSILSNSIHDNDGTVSSLGIDIAGAGPTANDLNDVDTGSNALQNFPVLTSATTDGSSTTVTGTLNSDANQNFTIEFFSNSASDPEGRTFLGSTSVTTVGNNVAFNAVLPVGTVVGDVITATATHAVNGTSEFSAPLGVEPPPLAVAKAFGTNPVAKNTITRLTITITNAGSTAATSLAFNDTYPAGLQNASTPNVSNTCGGTVTATAGANSISLSGGTLAGSSSCAVGVDVIGTAAGDLMNDIPAGAVTSATVDANTVAGADTLTVLFPPSVTKIFNPNTITPGGSSQLEITLTNSNSSDPITGVAFVDNLTAGLVVATPLTTSNTCGGTLTASAGGSTISLSGGTVPAAGTCLVTVAVTSSTPGQYVNAFAAGAVTSTNAGSSEFGTSDTLTVLAPPTVAKVFAPDVIAPGQTSQLTITVTNNTSTAMTGVNVTDNYPVQIVNAAVPAAATSCGGSVSATAGTSSVTLTGGTVPANSSCTVTVNVTSNTSGNHTNTINAGQVTTGTHGSNTAPASDALLVTSPLTVTKSFAPSSIITGGTSTLTVTLTNPNTVAITGVGFTDLYPAGVSNAATPNGSTTCAAGSVTALAAGNSLTFAAGTVPASSACTVSVTVTSSTVGDHANTIAAGDVTAANAPANSVAANATLSVGALASPTITKSFAPAAIVTGGTSQLTITLSNSNGVALTAVTFTDTYPAGVTNASPANAATTCGGAVTAIAGGNSVALTGGTIPASGSCTVTVDVTSATVGTHTNTIAAGDVTSANAPPNGAGASADLTVSALLPPTVAKSFTPATIASGGTSLLTITLTNPNSTALSSAAFTDVYPAAITNASPANGATSCGGTVSGTAGGGSVALSGGTIPANSSCTVTINVTSITSGSHDNTMAAGDVTSAEAPPNAAGASGTLTVDPMLAPTATKSFAPSAITPGGVSTLTITLNNPNGLPITGVGFTDAYPAGLINATPPNGTTTCGGTVTAAAGGGSLSLTGGVIPAGGSCTVSVTVRLDGTPSGPLVNSIPAGGITSANAPASGTPVSGTLTATLGEQVPTVSETALLILTLLLGTTAVLMLRR